MLDSAGSIQTEATQIAADHNIRFEAKEIKIDAAAQKNHEQYEKQVTNAGLMTNGLGIMVGKQKRKDEDDDRYITQQGTAIATNGKVTIKASKQATITSSDIVAAEGIDISAPEVTINGRENMEEHMRRHEESKTGITVGLGGNSYRAIESVNRPLQRANNVKDERLKGLYAWRAARELKKHGETLKNVAKGKLDIGVTIGVGSSHSESKTTTKSQEYVGSNIESQENVNLKATERDLSIIGSLVTGKDINLDAKENINLQAGENRTHTEVVEKSQSGGLRIDYSLSGKAWGNGLNVNYGESELRGNGYQITYTGTEIGTEGALNTKSGRDTTIIGSMASGNKVEMIVGGNLALETLQDIDNYQEKSHTKGFSSDIVNGLRPDIGINGSRGKIESEYQGTTEQTGIYAGKEGFQINTVGNTDLKGAVIASESASAKNKLSTGTLSWEDIDNKAKYKTDNYGIGLNMKGRKKEIEPHISIPVGADAKSKSKAAISAGTIEVNEKTQNTQMLIQNTKKAFNKLERIFDKDKVKERQDFTSLLAQEINREIGDISKREYKKSLNKYIDSKAGTAEAEQALKEMRKWETGGINKIALHTIGGVLISGIAGTNRISGGIGDGLNEAMQKELAKIKDVGGHEAASALLGRISSMILGDNNNSGEATAYNNTKYNFLLHDEQVNMAYELSEAIASKSRNQIIDVLAYYAALSSWHAQNPTMADYANSRTDEIIEGNLYGYISELTDPSRYGKALNPVLNDLVTNIYGWDAAWKTNIYMERMNEGDFTHAFYWAPKTSIVTPSQPERTTESILENGGWWNERGELVDKYGEIAYDMPNRGDYAYENGAEIIGYWQDGTAAVRIDGKDYPAYKAPKNFDWVQEAVKSIASEAESYKYGKIDEYASELPKTISVPNKVLKNVGGIIGGVFTAQDFYSDYKKYDSGYLLKAFSTDIIPVLGGAVGALYLDTIGSIGGGVGGAYIRDKMRTELELDR